MKTKIILITLLVANFFILNSCMKGPMACVDNATKSGIAGQPVSFDAGCSMNAHHCEWEFGDGATGSGTTVTHVYNSAGTYIAKLKAMSKSMKKEDEKSITVTVN